MIKAKMKKNIFTIVLCFLFYYQIENEIRCKIKESTINRLKWQFKKSVW